MKNKLLIAAVVLFALVVIIYNYLYKSHRDIATENVSYSVSVQNVYSSFKQNDSLANKKYLDKTIEIYGKITNIDLPSKIITVDEKLIARFTKNVPNNLKLKSFIALKGRLVGYDDLLEEIQMDQCTVKQ